MADAASRGLPVKDGWQVIYDNKQKRKLWISPKNKACKSIPEALAMAGIKPFEKKGLSEKERANALKRAKAKGLTGGWDVSWDSRRRRTIWISPDKSITCDSLPQALEVCGAKSRPNKRELTAKEVEDSLEEAKARGLRVEEGWTVSWDNKARRKRWISP